MNNISNLEIFTKMMNWIKIELVPFWKQFKKAKQKCFMKC
jgi:hypothetical protein